MVEKCEHGHQAPYKIIASLPEDQTQPGRHRCTVCAYSAGLTAVMTGEKVTCQHGNTAPLNIIKTLPENQGGAGRHRCVICAYAHAVGVNVADIEELEKVKDIEGIRASNRTETQKEALIQTRMGQGEFRSNLIRLYGKCLVTGVDDPKVLIASHIKPWRDSTDEERLDPYNGLLLAPHVDKLFDRGLITFNNSGKMLISSSAEESVRLWALPKNLILQDKVIRCSADYLNWHYENIFTK